MKFYGFISLADTKREMVSRDRFRCLSEHGVKSFHVIDPYVDDDTRYFYDWLGEEGVDDIVIAFRDRVHNPTSRREPEKLERAMKITNRIALGTTSLHEWHGRAAKAQMFLDYAERNGFEWVCSLIVSNLPVLIQAVPSQFRELMARTQTEIHCLCGQLFVAWEYGLTHLYKGVRCQQANRMDSNEMDWYTRERFTEWIRPLNMITGVGSQPGLDSGIPEKAKEMGFKGALCAVPFNLRERTE